MNAIEEYYQTIENGHSRASGRVTAVFKRLVDKIHNPADGYHFDEARANRPIEFIEKFCRLSQGEWAGQPMRLLLFQKAFLSALFGFVDDDGLRQYREAFFYVARKNSKSTMLAAIALYMLCADGEGAAEVYSIATKLDQSRLVFDEAWRMVQQSKTFRQNIRKRKSDLYFPATFSKFQALSSKSNFLDGLNSHLVIVDECHAIKDRNLYDVMKQSQSARKQPLMITITTAGFYSEGSLFDNLYQYSCSIADGKIEDKTFLPILYELDDRAEYLQPEMWIKANPAIDVIKKRDDLQTKVLRAAQSPAELSSLLCKDFNIIENVAQCWLSFEDINNTETFELANFKNSYAVGGIDLSRTIDLTAATIIILGKSGKRYVHQCCWIPAEGFEERVRTEKIPYDIWKEQGWLRLCAGNTIDYHEITRWFYEEILGQYQITPFWIYYDAWSARYLVDEMEQAGFRMEPCHQGFRTLSLPMKQLAADLQAKRVNYNNSPLLKWAISNVGLREDRNGNWLPEKANGRNKKIDPFSSLLNAYVALLDHHDELLGVAKGE